MHAEYSCIHRKQGVIKPYGKRWHLKVVYDYPNPSEGLSSSTIIAQMTGVAGPTRGEDWLSLIPDCETAMPIGFPVSQHCRLKDRQRNAEPGGPRRNRNCVFMWTPLPLLFRGVVTQGCLSLRILHRLLSRVRFPE